MDYWTLDYKLTRDKYIFMDTNFEVNYGTKDRAELHSLQSYLHSSFHLKYNGGKLWRRYSFLFHFSKMYSQDDSKSFFTAIKGTLYSRFVRQRRVLQFMRLHVKHSEKVTFKGFYEKTCRYLISQLYLGRKCTFLPRVKIQAFAALAVAKLQAVAK